MTVLLFTIGQRKGLSVGGGPAHYVVATDTNTNTVYVTSDPMSTALWTKTMDIVDTHWISDVCRQMAHIPCARAILVSCVPAC